MKKRITIAFFLIFSLFLSGSGVMIYNLVSTTDTLRNLIGMHEIEDIRQDLFSSVQKVSAYVYGSSTVFTDHLDEVISNTQKMHNAVRRCNECHHEPGVEAELLERQQQYQVLFEEADTIILLVDPDTAAIVDANPAACRRQTPHRRDRVPLEVVLGGLHRSRH